MTDMNTRALDRELKRGSAELLILSLLDARPRHGYELSKLIHTRSDGQLTFHIDSLYPLLYRLGAWVDQGDVGREARRATPPVLQGHGGRAARARAAAKDMGRICRGGAARDGRRPCLTLRLVQDHPERSRAVTGRRTYVPDSRRFGSRQPARPRSSTSSRSIWTTATGS
jgi:PadR family transcriptional regulator PadR